MVSSNALLEKYGGTCRPTFSAISGPRIMPYERNVIAKHS